MRRPAAGLALLLMARFAGAASPGVDALLDSARREIAAGRRTEAAKLLAQAAPLAQDAGRLERVASLYEDLQDYCRSAEASRRLVELRPKSADALILYADAAAYCGSRADAAAALERAFALADDANAYDQLAYLFLYNGQPARSVAASDRYVRLVPGDLWHWMRRVRACAESGDRAGAASALARAAALVDAFPAPALAAQYRRLRETSQYDAASWNLRWSAPAEGGWLAATRAAHQALARRALAQARTLEPLEPEALAHIGLIARGLGDDAGAREALERAAAGGSANADAWLTLAQLRADGGDDAAAREALARARTLMGDESSLLTRAADLDAQLHDCGAVAEYAALAAKSPDDGALLASWAAAADRCGDRVGARAAAQRALAHAAGDARVLAAAADVLERGDPCGASAAYGALRASQPRDAEWAARRARAALRCGDEKAAREAMDDAVALSSAAPTSLGRLAFLVAALGDCAASRRYAALAKRLSLDAASRLDEARALKNCGEKAAAKTAAGAALIAAAADADLAARAAELLAELGECPRALDALGVLVAAAPADPARRLDRASAAAACGNRALARADLKRAEAAANPAARSRAAVIEQDLGDDRRAVELLDGLVAAAPRDAALLSRRGVARALGGDAAGARRDLEAALALDPKRADVYLSLGSLDRRDGRGADARALFERGLAAVRPDDPLFGELQKAAALDPTAH